MFFALFFIPFSSHTTRSRFPFTENTRLFLNLELLEEIGGDHLVVRREAIGYPRFQQLNHRLWIMSFSQYDKRFQSCFLNLHGTCKNSCQIAVNSFVERYQMHSIIHE